MAPDLHTLVENARLEHRRCLALLAAAIARADRWYAEREAQLTVLDRHARNAVSRLQGEHRINASTAWNHP
jgi:hypothetical protein